MQTKGLLNKKASLFSTKLRERMQAGNLSPCSQASLYILQSRNIHGVLWHKTSAFYNYSY